MNKEFLTKFKHKKKTYKRWKKGQVTWEDYRNSISPHKNVVRKPKLIWSWIWQETKVNKKGFYRYISSKGKT